VIAICPKRRAGHAGRRAPQRRKALARTISRMMDGAELSAAQSHADAGSPSHRLNIASAVQEVSASQAFASEVQAVLKVPAETAPGVFAGHAANPPGARACAMLGAGLSAKS